MHLHNISQIAGILVITICSVLPYKSSDFQREAPVDHCRKCNYRLLRMGWFCDDFQKCIPGQVCFLQRLETTIGHISYYHGGCTWKAFCGLASSVSFANEYWLGSFKEGQCCHKTACNNITLFDKKDHVSATTHHSPSTVHVHTTVCLFCTFACSMFVLILKWCQHGSAPTTCAVCHGQECDSASGSVKLSQCPHHLPVCMTTVHNDKDGTKRYSKRCASQSECDQQWLKESIVKSECLGFHPTTNYTFNFTCHYCCDADECNKANNIPQTDSMYTGIH